jgi:hypothetical protein
MRLTFKLVRDLASFDTCRDWRSHNVFSAAITANGRQSSTSLTIELPNQYDVVLICSK